MAKAITGKDMLNRIPPPPEKLLKQYEPDAKIIFGRVWSEPSRGVMKAKNGKEYPTTYIKVFVYANTEKYRCTFKFEQAVEALNLQKGDNVFLAGIDFVTETVRTHKRYHNFKVTKFAVLPNGYESVNFRLMEETYNALLDAYDELNDRVCEIENVLHLQGVKLPPPKGDNRRGLKKRQSLENIVGDIYAGITDEDRGRL